MDQVQRVLAEIRTYLGKLSVTQRLLIASTIVIAVMTLFLVTQYAAGPTLVSLPGIPPQDQPRVLRALQSASFNAQMRDGGIVVPKGTQADALALLGESGDLPDDTTILFNNLTSKQDWRQSREQHRQQAVFALQNELGRIIGKFSGVRSASVIIDSPERQGLGRTSRDPTASVTVFPQNGLPLDQNTVDAVASLVAGARSGLQVKNVRVIDGVTRQQRSATDESVMAAGTYLDHQAKVERDTLRKLESLLAYIPGVIVAVSAEVDVSRVSEQTRSHLKKGEGSVSMIKSENSVTIEAGGAADGAEPGVRSMQGADINSAPSSGSSGSSQEESDTTFENAIGTKVREMVDPRGMPTFLAASVNVPESYIAELIRLENPPEDGAEPENPTTEAVLARFDDIRVQIEKTVKPHLKTRSDGAALMDGDVEVAMIPTQVLAAMGASAGGGGVLGILGGGGIAGDSVLDTALLGGLALISLTMMVMMVRRSSKKIELPTAEELVGVPPILENSDDLVGEAEEGEGVLAGIEIHENDVERNKMLDQISDLIATEPQKAASLMGRWMATGE